MPAVDDVSFEIRAGETLGLVGESGSGKSVTALSIMRLVQPPGRIAGGRIAFKGRDLLTLDEAEMRAVRGAEIALIFQEPMTALNPVFTIGDQIAETLLVHGRATRREAPRTGRSSCSRRSAFPTPRARVDDYPHQLSGGMRQRVLIAMALACQPSLVIADEPTTALDVTIQAQILDLLREMKSAFNLSLLLITHDLGVIAETADRVAVMYAGRIVEDGPVRAIFREPAASVHARAARVDARRRAGPAAARDRRHRCRCSARCRRAARSIRAAPIASSRARSTPPPDYAVGAGSARRSAICTTPACGNRRSSGLDPRAPDAAR